MLRFLLCLALFVTACGYRPSAGRLAPDLAEDIRFAPFRVRNDTPDLALTHVVLEAARGELGRRSLLAEQSAEEPAAVYVDLSIRRFAETPASYSPAGDVLEYYGEMWIDYRLYQADSTAPSLAGGSDRLKYRYDFRANPQNLRLYRYAAMNRSVRDWIPRLAWLAADSLRRQHYAATSTPATERP